MNVVQPNLISESEIPPARGEFSGRRVAFAGKLGGANRREVRQILRQAGGIMLEAADERADLIVVGADQLPLEGFADCLSDEILDAAGRGLLEIISETEFWQRLGLADAELDVKRFYTPAMLADLLGVPLATVRRWHRRGLITAVRQVNRLPYFDFEEVASARHLARLIASGETPQLIERKLVRLAELFPGLSRPLSQLSIIVEGRDVLLRRGDGLVEAGGRQLRFDFGSVAEIRTRRNDRPVAGVIDFSSEQTQAADWSRFRSADEFLSVANEFEDEGRLEEAKEVYRAMMLALGPSADVCFRLAEALYMQGDLPAARERYYMAVEMDESFVEARASLGCVLMELGQIELAESAFQGALRIHPSYPDVHFHLAQLLDEQGRGEESRGHWDEFLKLAPKSPWAEEARERLGIE